MHSGGLLFSVRAAVREICGFLAGPEIPLSGWPDPSDDPIGVRKIPAGNDIEILRIRDVDIPACVHIPFFSPLHDVDGLRKKHKALRTAHGLVQIRLTRYSRVFSPERTIADDPLIKVGMTVGHRAA